MISLDDTGMTKPEIDMYQSRATQIGPRPVTDEGLYQRHGDPWRS